jgi:hypothetical protein
MQINMNSLSLSNPRQPTGIAGPEPPLAISGTTSENGPFLVTPDNLTEGLTPDLLFLTNVEIKKDDAIGTKFLDIRTSQGLVPNLYAVKRDFVTTTILPISAWSAFYSSFTNMEYDIVFQFIKVQDCRAQVNLSVNYSDSTLLYNSSTMVNHTSDIHIDSVEDFYQYSVPQFFYLEYTPSKILSEGITGPAPARNIYLPKTRISGHLSMVYAPNDMQPLTFQILAWLRLKPTKMLGYAMPSNSFVRRELINLPYWIKT